jgi:sarcosine oxidase
MTIVYDVIVVGVGSMGSAACYHLAKRGAKVLGVEQFDIVHQNGSHFGQSRLIRKAYFEHPDYVPLLLRSYENWKEIEDIANTQLYFETGIAYVGPSGNELMANIRHSAKTYELPLKPYEVSSFKSEFPQFNIPVSYEVMVEPEAGIVTPERAIWTFAEEAVKLGAEIMQGCQVEAWKQVNDLVHVTTNKGEFVAKKVIFTAGAWTKKLLPDFRPKLKVTEQFIAWFKPDQWERFTVNNFPCWAWEVEGYIYYGFPILPSGDFMGPIGLKVAHHFPGKEIQPKHIGNNDPTNEIRKLTEFLYDFIPGAAEQLLSVKSCLYTYSEDDHFIIDQFTDNVVIAAGFSGHGFKFIPVVGEVLADLALEGNSRLPIDFLKLR